MKLTVRWSTCGEPLITRVRCWKATSAKTRDKGAALAFIKEALKRHGSPDKIFTDGLRSYGATMTELGCREKQETGNVANNRV